MIRPHRNHPLWYAFILHRLSGLGLVLFLPAHFYLLSLAMTDPVALETALKFTAHPFVKFAEWGLVFLFAVHLFGGIRLLVSEWVQGSADRWTSTQKSLAVGSAVLALLTSGLFLIGAL